MHEVDLIILGKVNAGPCSAYELQKDMDRRNLSSWINVSTTSLYKAVLRLEKQGYLTGNTVREGKMPEKTVYTITGEGARYLEETLVSLSKQAVRILFPLNAVIVNLDQLPKEQSMELLRDIRQEIQRTHEFLKASLEQYSELPLVERTIIEQQCAVAQTLETWADGFKQEYEQK